MAVTRIVEGGAALSRRERLVAQYALVELSRAVRAGRTNHWDLADGPPPTEDEVLALVARVLDPRGGGESAAFEQSSGGRTRRVEFIGGADGPAVEVDGRHLGFFDLGGGPDGRPRLVIDRGGDGPPAAVITLLPGGVGVAVDPAGAAAEFVLPDHPEG